MMDMNEYIYTYISHNELHGTLQVSFPNNYAVIGINFKSVNKLKLSPQLTETHKLKGYSFFCNNKKAQKLKFSKKLFLFGFNLKQFKFDISLLEKRKLQLYRLNRKVLNLSFPRQDIFCMRQASAIVTQKTTCSKYKCHSTEMPKINFLTQKVVLITIMHDLTIHIV